MREIKILELRLRNFKGIKELNLTPKGKDLYIYGRNEAGKTSIMDAFIWLLFDKDSSNDSNFSIKTLDGEGNPIHMLEHEVLAKLSIDGKEIELQKIYKEKWTKKRGQANSELTGHTTDCFINGVPKKKSEYTNYLSNIISEDLFKILTNPLYFNEKLKWQDRREIALKMCGDIDNLEVIRHDEKLKPLGELLSDKTLEDLKAEMAARRKKLNDELKSIPVRIDELSREDLVVDVEELTAKKKDLVDRLQEIKSSESTDHQFKVRRIRGSIGVLENELKELERNHTRDLRESLEQCFKDKSNISKSYIESKDKVLSMEREIQQLHEKKRTLDSEIVQLREVFKDTKVQEFNDEDTVCPCCQQHLQPEKIQSLISDFNERKANKLRQINEDGKEKSETLKQLIQKIEGMEEDLYHERNQYGLLSDMLESKTEEIASLEEQIDKVDVSKTTEYKNISIKIKELEGEIDKIDKLIDSQADITRTIKELEESLLSIDKQLAKVDLAKNNEKRKQELLSRERELAQLVAKTEGIEFLCEQFVIVKASLLEEKLNSKFEMVKFKLFDVQVNGGINETFITTHKGVPFDDLNDAAKINSGLDIINTLSKEYEISLPLFLDNRESVNNILKMNGQIINLVVSWDKSLQVDEGEKWEALKAVGESS